MVCKTGLLKCNAAIFTLRPAWLDYHGNTTITDNITVDQPKKHFGHNSVLFYTKCYAMIILEQEAMMTTRLLLIRLHDTAVKMSINHLRCTSTI